MACTNIYGILPQVGSRACSESHTNRTDDLLVRGPSESGEGQITLSLNNNKQNNNKHKIKSKGMLKISTWNVRTLLDSKRIETVSIPRRTAIVARELEKLKIDVAGLQETHLLGFGSLEERKAGYTYETLREKINMVLQYV